MNSQNSKIVKTFIKSFLFFSAFFVNVTVKAWDIDMSRRQQDLNKYRGPASMQGMAPNPNYNPLSVNMFDPKKEELPLMEGVFDSFGPTQELVILNTENGFIPETLNLKKGGNYKINVVNVNEKEKNTSFLLDSFSEHHATYFGQRKTFTLTPKMDGVYAFVCPETAKQGRIIVYSETKVLNKDRKPSNE